MAITSPGCLLPHQPLLTISLSGAKPETRWEVDRRKPSNLCPSISGATLFSAACAGSNSTVYTATTGEGSLGYRDSRAFPNRQGTSQTGPGSMGNKLQPAAPHAATASTCSAPVLP